MIAKRKNKIQLEFQATKHDGKYSNVIQSSGYILSYITIFRNWNAIIQINNNI